MNRMMEALEALLVLAMMLILSVSKAETMLLVVLCAALVALGCLLWWMMSKPMEIEHEDSSQH